jgi:hypothetical protein
MHLRSENHIAARDGIGYGSAEGRFFGECLIVAIRFFKHEVSLWRGFLIRLKRELTTWEN